MKTIKLKKIKNKVYFKIEDGDECLLTFDELKKFGQKIIEYTAKNEDNDYNIIYESDSLKLYKDTIENVINSIKEDVDLIQLYKSVSKQDKGTEEY